MEVAKHFKWFKWLKAYVDVEKVTRNIKHTSIEAERCQVQVNIFLLFSIHLPYNSLYSTYDHPRKKWIKNKFY